MTEMVSESTKEPIKFSNLKTTIMTVIKWLGTILIILATLFRAGDMHMADMLATLVGASLWSYAAWKTSDKALFAVNIFSVLVMLVGIYYE
jgi:hypothetical protein